MVYFKICVFIRQYVYVFPTNLTTNTSYFPNNIRRLFVVEETDFVLCEVKVKVKQSRNRPCVAQRFPGGLGSQIS
jgi:hypothetical protein